MEQDNIKIPCLIIKINTLIYLEKIHNSNNNKIQHILYMLMVLIIYILGIPNDALEREVARI